MPVDDVVSGVPMALEARGSIRVECYVRPTVPGPVVETVDTVIERLRRLADHERIGSYQVTEWPPAHRRLERGAETTRDELVAAFERWADRADVSLEPAFRRRESVPSPIDTDASYDRLRVPVVALAVYDDAGAAETLCGVVPYTEPHERGHERTYTVAEWLTAVESPDLTGPAHVPETTG